MAGFPFAVGARLICEEIARFDVGSLDDARFIAYGDDEFEALVEMATSSGSSIG